MGEYLDRKKNLLVVSMGNLFAAFAKSSGYLPSSRYAPKSIQDNS
jgi:hypothetical protein